METTALSFWVIAVMVGRNCPSTRFPSNLRRMPRGEARCQRLWGLSGLRWLRWAGGPHERHRPERHRPEAASFVATAFAEDVPPPPTLRQMSSISKERPEDAPRGPGGLRSGCALSVGGGAGPA